MGCRVRRSLSGSRSLRLGVLLGRDDKDETVGRRRRRGKRTGLVALASGSLQTGRYRKCHALPRSHACTQCRIAAKAAATTLDRAWPTGGTAAIRPNARVASTGLTRFVIDCETLLRIAAGEIEVAAEHKLVAPTLVRSQALSALYEAARRGEISAAEGIERVTRINSLKVRFLGDKVLQQKAWKVADQLGWETTFDAEFVALTQLQADVFITSDGDLARAVSGLVETATIDALRTA
jgi:predicted nucleic acid-binding protein